MHVRFSLNNNNNNSNNQNKTLLPNPGKRQQPRGLCRPWWQTFSRLTAYLPFTAKSRCDTFTIWMRNSLIRNAAFKKTRWEKELFSQVPYSQVGEHRFTEKWQPNRIQFYMKKSSEVSWGTAQQLSWSAQVGQRGRTRMTDVSLRWTGRTRLRVSKARPEI